MSISPSKDPAPGPAHAAQVFHADDIYVASGVNSGEGLGPPEAVSAGDVYALDEGAQPLRLSMRRAGGQSVVAEGSSVGAAGDPVRTLARHILMSGEGDRVELVLLSVGEALFALPLTPMHRDGDYTLLQSEPAGADETLTDLMCLSFARGTMIALATGRQVPIESLAAGDVVLTRDHGPQPVRLVARATFRAVGGFAPVVISAGTMGNSGDLIVSQHHRMFLYQRRRQPGGPGAELLIQARHLVDDERVFLRETGFTDWFGLIFDRHEIIYAEGIPAESLLVNDATVNRLPPELASEVRGRFPGLAHIEHFGTEAGRQFLEEIGTAALYPSPRTRDRPF